MMDFAIVGDKLSSLSQKMFSLLDSFLFFTEEMQTQYLESIQLLLSL